jgi:sulfate adenylyltransferase subunit 1 (EFTu-like GTPase family)
MKNFLIVASLLLLCLSCQNETADFNGLEPLAIGQDFATIAKESSFRKVMDGEYYADEFTLNNGLGKISKVNVSTIKGKIAEVRFSNSTSTNMPALKKMMSSLNEVKFGPASAQLMTQKQLAFKAYSNTKNKTNLIVIEHKDETLKNGRPLYEFQYNSNEAEKENEALTRKNMGLGKK